MYKMWLKVFNMFLPPQVTYLTICNEWGGKSENIPSRLKRDWHKIHWVAKCKNRGLVCIMEDEKLAITFKKSPNKDNDEI